MPLESSHHLSVIIKTRENVGEKHPLALKWVATRLSAAFGEGTLIIKLCAPVDYSLKDMPNDIIIIMKSSSDAGFDRDTVNGALVDPPDFVESFEAHCVSEQYADAVVQVATKT